MYAELIHQKKCKNYTVITYPYTGEIACNSCSSVFSEMSIGFATKMTYSRKDYQNRRVGQRISLKMIDMGLSTIIESRYMDSTGKLLSTGNRRMFYRLRIWDENSRSNNSIKSSQKAFILLDGISSKLRLSESVVEQAAYLFRKSVVRISTVIDEIKEKVGGEISG
ncbi:MAG: hypothetical protein OEW49_05100 [Nitrosopumilus sp.]|nr:hypothetical protein [Nitrosopumilus sp.]